MELTIERMIYGGDGLGRLPTDPGHSGRGKAVFVPFVLPGETVQAHLAEEKAGFVRGTLHAVDRPSPKRIEAACPYFLRCGGCQYQHIDYEEQVRIKVDVLRETLKRTGGIEIEPAIQTHTAEPWGYRNRTRFHVRHEPQFAVGYHRFRSHRLLPVEACPISAPLIHSVLGTIVRIGASNGVPAWVREIEILTDPGEAAVLLSLFCDATSFTGTAGKVSAMGLESFAGKIGQFVPQLEGIAAFEVEAGEPRLVATAGEAALTYPTAYGSFRVSAGSFFQTNRFLLEEMIRLATTNGRGKRALDLYAGVGLFSLLLSRQFEEVWSVETSRPSFSDLEYNLRNDPHVHPKRSSVEDFLVKQRTPADYVVVDPPRAGLGPEVCRALEDLAAPRICYVSCDPATLARDLKMLLGSGYQIAEAHLVDMFPQTFHIESIVHLVR